MFEIRKNLRQFVYGYLMFARQSAQCKQAAFDILKLVLIQADVSRSFFQLIDRLVNVNQRLVKHTDNFVILTVDQRIRPPHCRLRLPQRRLHVGPLGKRAKSITQAFDNLFGIHHFQTFFAQRFFFAGFGRDFFQFVDPMTQRLLVASGSGNIVFRFNPRRFSRFVSRKFSCNFRQQLLITGISVQNIAMIGRIKQSLIVKLSVNLNQIFADFLQELRTYRLVIEKDFALAVAVEAALNRYFGIGFKFIRRTQGIKRIIFVRNLKHGRYA